MAKYSFDGNKSFAYSRLLKYEDVVFLKNLYRTLKEGVEGDIAAFKMWVMATFRHRCQLGLALVEGGPQFVDVLGALR